MLISKDKISFRKKLLACGVSAAAFFAPTYCYASPEDGDGTNVDTNGVDIVSLQFQIQDPYNSFKIGPNIGYEHTISGDANDLAPTITKTWLVDNGGSISISQMGLYVVGSEMRYYSYDSATSKYWSTLGDKSYIVKQSHAQYLLYESDGRKVTFNSYHGPNASGQPARITKISYPNGLIVNILHKLRDPVSTSLTYSNFIVGPHAISDNNGYLVLFEYQSDVRGTAGFTTIRAVRGYSLVTDNCYVGALHCAVIPGRPRLTFQHSTGGLTVTNSNGSVSRFFTTGTGSNTSLQTLHVQFPDGYAAGYDNMAVNFSANQTVHSIIRGSSTWLYATSSGPTNDTALRKITDPEGSIENYIVRYAPVSVGNRVYSRTDSVGRTKSYSYDTLWRMTRVTQPEGNYVQLSRDANANVIEVRQVSKTPGTPPDMVESQTFPASCANLVTCHLPLSTTDARGNVTNYVYDQSHGGAISVTSPAAVAGGVRPQVRNTYTPKQAYFRNSVGTVVASGQPIQLLTTVSQCKTAASCSGTSDEIKATVDYGPQTNGVANNLLPISVSASSGDGAVTSVSATTYDALGNVATTDGPLAGNADITANRYDSMGRMVGEIGPDPDGAGPLLNAATRVTINDVGRSRKVESGTTAGQSDTAWQNFSSSQSVETKLDTAGRVETEIAASNSGPVALKQYSYDANGRLDCVAVRMNPAAYANLPSSACTAGVAGTMGPDRIAKANYNSAGDLTQAQRAFGTANVVNEAMGYTPNGKVAYVVDGNSNRTTYEYDGHDRIVKSRYPVAAIAANSSSVSDFEQFTYDSGSNVTQRRMRDGSTISSTYDNLNRITSRTPTGENPVYYSYNLLGAETLIQRPADGVTLSYAYDGLGRLTSETQPFGSMTYQYDTGGRMVRRTWSDGFYATYDYDALGRVTAIRENGATSGIGVLATYTYDSLGRRAAITRGNGTVTNYGYDPASRLTSLSQNLSATDFDYSISGIAYNPAGQITGSTKSNDAFAWTAHVNTERAYTTNGLNQYGAAGTTAFTYDQRGNLIGSGGSAYSYSNLNELKTAPGVSMYYDPTGRLVEYNTATSTRFYYSGSQLVAEVANPGGAILRRYVPGPGQDEPIVWYEGAAISDRRFLHADERGSIIAITNGAGSAIAVNRYDEYGIPQDGNAGRFQYTGQTWFTELGMYNYKARIYSPTLGRFMQTDPIGYGDGLNWYAYAANDPINGTDPSGNGAVFGPTLSYYEGGYPMSPDSLYYSPNTAVTVIGGRNQSYAPPGIGPWSNAPLARGGSAPPGLGSGMPGNQQGALQSGSQKSDWLIDRCSTGYKVADWALWGAGIAGDGIAIVGIVTLNPGLFYTGKAISTGSTAGSILLHAAGGDGAALAGDAAGYAAGSITGGGSIWRKVGGAAGDAGLNRAGRYVPNHVARRKGQDVGIKSAQGQYGAAAIPDVGGC